MRLEYKFLVPNKHLPWLRRRVAPFVDVDKYSQNKEIPEYTVRSIYFDSADLKFYYEKLAGIKTRKKLRIRGYNQVYEDSKIFLEIKRKHENFVSKNRAPLYYRDLELFLDNKEINEHILPGKDKKTSFNDAGMFIHHLYRKSLQPIILVVYDREAYFSKFNDDLRITFDKDLRYLAFPKLTDLYQEKKLQLALNGFFILEIKFTKGFPAWLQHLLKELKLSRQAISKYTICLDSERTLNPNRHRATFAFTHRFAVNRSYSTEEKS